MALFGDFFGAVHQAQESGGSLKEKLDTIAPVAKQEADNLGKVYDNLQDVYKDIRQTLDAPDLNAASQNARSASDKWDKYFEEYYISVAVKNNPEKYSSYPELSDDAKASLASDVDAVREAFENEAKKHIGENLFELGSKVKNQAADVISTIDKSLGKIQKVASQIEKGTKETIKTIEKIANQGQKIFGKYIHNNLGDTASKSVWLNNFANIGTSRLGMAAAALGGAAGGVSAMVSAFRTHDIKGGVNTAKSSVNTVRQNWSDADHKRGDFFSDKESLQSDISQGRHWGLDHKPKKQPQDSPTPKDKDEEKEEDSNRADAEFVSEITVILDGKKGDGFSGCTVGDTEYSLSNYQLRQRMLYPMELSFTMVKKDIAEEDERDVKYDVCKQIIGLELEMTVKTQYSDSPSTKASEFTFKGLITGVSASRGTGGAPSIYVTASSHDYLLHGAPNCRSFENKTLEEIVSAVISPVKNLKSRISPRLKTPIPYIVQYNQSDYDFLASLARRFGEWMYHNGTEFVFGEIVPPSESVVRMRYPGGNVFSHGVDLHLRDMNIMHVTSDLYNYGENGIIQQTDEGTADRKTHELNDATYERVRSLYSTRTVYYPHIGGAFDNGKEEGTKELMLNSVKVTSRGKRAQMFISNGSSKVAKLFLGQQFQIEDGVENLSPAKGEVDQPPLMILSVTHNFDLSQTYENTFEALPPSCDYPPYGNAAIFTPAFPQRATIVANVDPMGLGRVRVQFPWQKVQDNGEEKMWSPWIRIAQSYGGFSKGSQVISELHEEVMVGFEMDNIERPYVIGALSNGTDSNPEEWNETNGTGTTNNYKAFRSRNGHTIQICDEGDGGDIQIYDHEKNNYLIHLSTDGKYIRIEAKGDIQIVAGNDITMQAAKNITIKAGENVSVESGKDTDISADANMSLSAEDNMQQQATDIYVKASDALNEESGNSHMIKTTTLQEKASGKASIDGGGLVEITAASVKVR